MGIFPKTPLGWGALILVGYLVFKTVGATQAGVAVGHAIHNAGTFLVSTVKNI